MRLYGALATSGLLASKPGPQIEMAAAARKISVVYMLITFLAILFVLALVFPIKEGFNAAMGIIKARGEACAENTECESKFCHTAVCT